MLFIVNTRSREAECAGLRWKWEVHVIGMEYSVLMISESVHRWGTPAGMIVWVILNRVTQSILEGQRGRRPEYVFTYRGQPMDRLVNTAWKKARVRSDIGAHALRHTYGKRLRGGRVSFRDVQDLLGYKTQSVTAHYSRAEIFNLIEAANLVCEWR